MADQPGFAPRSMKRKNFKALALTPAPKPPPTAETMIPESRKEEQSQVAQLEIGIEYKMDLRPEDLDIIKDLGSGNGGTVSKVRHITTGTVMARKIIHVEAKKEMRKRIVRELQIMHSCHSEYIVNFYGAFLNENNDVIMCMEYMDVGSLDRVSRDFGPVRVDVLGKIAVATLGGLTYLYSKHHIMHRDIKPSNILVNSRGSIKLCDFGVSGELINSIADTFVGTSTYMAPERIQGEKYTVKSDVWSFGLTIMELAIGKFPFAASEQLSDGDCAPAGILDLLQQIVHEPAPKLPKSDAFPAILEDMIQKCLSKNPDERLTPQDLFDRDPFVQAAKRTPVDLREWAVGMMEKDNRKSHLVPPLSPSTQELLRSSDSPTYGVVGMGSSAMDPLHTPTSGEIPIAGAGIVSPRDAQMQNYPAQQTYHYGAAPVGNRSSPTRGMAMPNMAMVGGMQQQQQQGAGMMSNGIGRAGPSLPSHPGMGQRVVTTNSIPRLQPSSSSSDLGVGMSGLTISGAAMGMMGGGIGNGPASANAATFNLPMRPVPPGGPLPPPPPRKETPDELRRQDRRQATFGPPSNGSYGSGYGGRYE